MLRNCLFFILIVAPPALAQSPTVSSSHLRSTEAWVLDLLRDGCGRSTVFRDMVTELEATDTIVYVQPGACTFGHLDGCLNTTITLAGGVRYLRITFDPHRRQLLDAEELAVIGHELHHALEIARAREVRTSEDVIRLFRRIGFSPRCPHGLSDCYETQAARLIGDRIRDELMTTAASR
jgi:hypothetical protein